MTCPGCATALHLECTPECCPTLGCDQGFANVRARVAMLGPRRDCVPAGPVARSASIGDSFREVSIRRCLRQVAWSLALSCVLAMTALARSPSDTAAVFSGLVRLRGCGCLQQ